MSTEANKNESPFGFLDGEDDEVITQVHSLIKNFQLKLDSVDKSINGFLSGENKLAYKKFKKDLKIGVPWEVAAYSPIKRNIIFEWICKAWDIQKLPEQVGDEKTLEEILKLSKEKLKEFERSRELRAERNQSNEIEEVRASIVEPNSPDEPVPPQENNPPPEEAEYSIISESDKSETDQFFDTNETAEVDKIATTTINNGYQPENWQGSMQLDNRMGHQQDVAFNGAGTSSSFANGLNLRGARTPTPERLRQYNFDFPSNETNDVRQERPDNIEAGQEAVEDDEYSTPDASLTQNVSNQPNFHPPTLRLPPIPPHKIHVKPGNDEPLNVMLIGQTGVGKTTFINASQNYLKYESLEEALAGGPLVPIPTSFDMVVEQGSKPIGITIGQSSTEESANEQLDSKRRESRTQKAMIHEFQYSHHGKTKTVRFVDTPGVLDTRGREKDKENYYVTMEIIRELPHIHAICILLQPNEARLTPELIYILDFLLVYLPKTALQHIVFGFTCTEAFDFRPAETLPVLEEYLKGFAQRTNVSIPIIKENTFGFDNKCFRFQCTVKNYPGYKSKEDDYLKSWNNNRCQLYRMLEYVQRLEPFPTADTANIAHMEKKLQKHVDVFINITRKHAKELVDLKRRWKAESSHARGEQISAEVKERGKCFNSILTCVGHFTEFFYRKSVGIEDLFGKQLKKVIKDEEAGRHYKLVEELKRIADEYRRLTNDLIHKTLTKEIPVITPEEIETMLCKVKKDKYYGSRIVSSSKFSRQFQ